MERARWNHVSEKTPLQNGKYWVYPYRTLKGATMIAMINFVDGIWEQSYAPQVIEFWRKIEVPKPPRVPKTYFKKEIHGQS